MFFCLNQADPDTLPITLTEDTSSSSSVIPSGVDPAVVMPAETSSTSPILPEETSVSSGVPSGVDPAVVTPAETSSTSPILPEETSAPSAVLSGVDPAVVVPPETSSTSLAVMSSKRFYGSSLAKPERERRLRKKPIRYQ